MKCDRLIAEATNIGMDVYVTNTRIGARKSELIWHSTDDSYPTEDCQCLCMVNKWMIPLTWNHYHQCWDDWEGDDIKYEKDQVQYWAEVKAFKIEV